MTLTREQLLAARELPRQKVSVPELDGEIYVRVMSGTERDAYEAALIASKEKRLENMRANLIVRCACDEAGTLLFKLEDAEAVGKLTWLALDRLAGAAQKLNRLTDADIETTKGNSEPSPGDAQS